MNLKKTWCQILFTDSNSSATESKQGATRSHPIPCSPSSRPGATPQGTSGAGRGSCCSSAAATPTSAASTSATASAQC